jgi:hypothetical protein
VTKAWQPYALHILDAITRIPRIQVRGDPVVVKNVVAVQVPELEKAVRRMLSEDNGDARQAN